MSFRISHSVSGGIPLVNLHNDKRSATVSIAPGFGALLHAFEILLPEGSYNIINNYRDLEDIRQNLGLSYKSSKLSPFPCRIKNGQYSFGGKRYAFSRKFLDGSAIHGLLFNKAFSLTGQSVTDLYASANFTYAYTKDDPGYPYTYTCTVKYTLLPGQTLQVQTILENTGSETIPIADGWHPYFQLRSKIDDCLLEFPSSGMLEFDEKLIPTGQVHPFRDFVTARRIGDTRLDNCFMLEENAGQPVCIFSNPAQGISIRFMTDENYPFLQLYTPDDRQSIAVENLSGAPDCFNNKMGLLLLEPGARKSLNLHYQVNTGETA